MANTIHKTRVQLKNDTAENWAKAENFVPLVGEMIVYSDLNTMKIGDGTTKVNDLPFVHTPLMVTGTATGKENKYTADKTVDEISEALIAGQPILLSFDTSVFAFQSAISLGGTTAIIYSGSLENIIHAVQIGTDITITSKKLLTEDDVRELINKAQLLKKKIILSSEKTTSGLWNVTNSNGEVEAAAEDYMYLQKISEGSSADAVYAQYSLIQNELVELGTTRMSLDGYVTDDELTAALAAYTPSSGEGAEEIYIGTEAPAEGSNYKVWINPEDSGVEADDYITRVDLKDYQLVSEAFSGSYNDLTDKPTLFSGSYNDLSNKPTLFSGSYNDLTNKPAVAATVTATGTDAVSAKAVYDFVQSVFGQLTNGDEVRY